MIDDLRNIITVQSLERSGWVAERYAGRIFWTHEALGNRVRYNFGAAVEQEKMMRYVRAA